MIIPFLKDQAFLDSVEHNREFLNEDISIWWTGQSGFLVQSPKTSVFFDPYLSDSLTEKYKDTDKPHVRMTELVIEPTKLDFVDVITSSHNHTDHLDAFTLNPLFNVNPDAQFIIPEANREFVCNRLKCDPSFPIGMNDSESVDLHDIQIHAVPSAHEKLDQDAQGRCHYLGYILKIGRWCVYHSGDTMLFDGMEDILKAYNIDIALLPINGRKPERRVAGNLNGAQAAQLAKDINATIVIPCHYDMFEFNTETTQLFEETCQSLDQGYRILKNGQGFLTSGLSPRSASA